MRRLKPLLISVMLISIALAGCTAGFRGAMPPADGPPLHDVDVSGVADAVPRVEAIRRAGNKNPYTVLGQTYHLLETSRGYQEEGVASWYGSKFHGNKTANGETYSMYGMTAAHKTLPIPSYVRVTNLDNKRSVIVRVNDRGPFHDNRIIDLSYVAAKKLGYEKHGTARVEVTAIDPKDYQSNTVQAPALVDGTAAAVPQRTALSDASEGRGPRPNANPVAEIAARDPSSEKPAFLQIGAYTSYQSAVRYRDQIAGLTSYPVNISKTQTPVEQTSLFKVMVGPIADRLQLAQVRRRLETLGLFKSFVVYDAQVWGS